MENGRLKRPNGILKQMNRSAYILLPVLCVSVEAFIASPSFRISSCDEGWWTRIPQHQPLQSPLLPSFVLSMPRYTTAGSVGDDNNNADDDSSNDTVENVDTLTSRRSFVTNSMLVSSIFATTSLVATTPTASTQASVGTLPEYSDTDSIVQGISIRVADQSQQKAMISFLEDGFDCEVIRKRIVGSIEETWLGFGPEQLRIPNDFTIPVSSFSKYGGHASIHLIYDAKETTPFYRIGDTAPGNNIAYLQLGVPTYRISQMVNAGGNVLDAYGIVNVISPSGLPIRGIVGIAPDPIMLVAINCIDMKQSQKFYEQLGFAQRPYPFCRPNQGAGPFEPTQPAKSIYLAPSSNSMGVLLLKSKERKIVPNPAVQSMTIVYNPIQRQSVPSTDDTTEVEDDDDIGGTRTAVMTNIRDPSGLLIQFQSVTDFETEEKITR